MKSSIIVTLMLISTSIFAFNTKAMYEVTLTNLTKGQPVTPLIITTSKGMSSLYTLGAKATPGLLGLAEDGKTALLKEEQQMMRGSQSVVTGSSLTMPGQSVTLEVEGSRRSYLSLAAMLAKTNDAFIGAKNISLKLNLGESKMVLLHVYDAGTEENNELSAYIPAFGSGGVRTTSNEGFVHPHAGLVGNGDLNLATDSFAFVAAKVIIKRIK